MLRFGVRVSEPLDDGSYVVFEAQAQDLWKRMDGGEGKEAMMLSIEPGVMVGF